MGFSKKINNKVQLEEEIFLNIIKQKIIIHQIRSTNTSPSRLENHIIDTR
jgi:hypothetical protein